MLVRFIPDDKDDVGRDLVGRLVPLPLEGDLGPRLPARLHVDGEYLLLLSGSAVVVDHPT